jgi:hypothetical protein
MRVLFLSHNPPQVLGLPRPGEIPSDRLRLKSAVLD